MSFQAGQSEPPEFSGPDDVGVTMPGAHLNQLLQRLRPSRLLVLSAAPGLMPDIKLPDSSLVVHLCLRKGTATGAFKGASEALPLSPYSFDLVILHHVVSDGSEAEFAEATRVLNHGGQLLVIGRGWFSVQGRNDRKMLGKMPRLRLRRITQTMEQAAFRIRSCEGLGLMGRQLHLQSRWQQPMLPMADSLWLRGRLHDERPTVTPLRFNKPVRVGAAALDGLSREAL